MNNRATTWLWIAGAAALLGGCDGGRNRVDTGGTPREVDVPNELVAKARPPVPDIPVPLGFKLDDDSSRSLAAAGTRWVEHRYTGGADKWAVGRFYKRQMPQNGWTLDNDRMSRGEIVLEFSKGGERCQIRITDGGLFTASDVRVYVYPVGG